MGEPLATALGLKYSTLVAGFVGALVSLSFVVGLSLSARATAVLAGMAVAVYGTPLVVTYWALNPPAENGVAFLLGLTAMNIVPGVMAVSKWLRDNATGVLATKLGIAPNGEDPK